MTLWQELRSWFVPGTVDLRSVPRVGSEAPSTPDLPFPREGNKKVVIGFLRHCGCPFAEKTFRSLAKLANQRQDIEFVAVSHSDRAATENWTSSLGDTGPVTIIVDDNRRVYGAFGLGISSFWHVLNPWSLAAVFQLGRAENIWNRPTESGTRWQTGGLFAVDAQGVIRYAHPAQTTDDLGDFETAVKSVSGS